MLVARDSSAFMRLLKSSTLSAATIPNCCRDVRGLKRVRCHHGPATSHSILPSCLMHLDTNRSTPGRITMILYPKDLRWHCSDDRMIGSAEHLHKLLYQNPNDPGKVPPNRNELWGSDRFHST